MRCPVFNCLSRRLRQKRACLAFLVACLPLTGACAGAQVLQKTEASGVPVNYQLPVTGPLPQTYRVTLAIVDPKNPDWIISQFAAGVARTVTAENGGRFAEVWDGLDDNFMPVPPGDFAVKGIYMLARPWRVDQEWHSVTPKFAGGASSWLPSPEQWQKPEPFGGDPVGAPLRDVAVGANGVAVFYYEYLENGLNNPMFDLNQPAGYGQFLRAFGSGGAAGGTSVTTDGESIWAFSTDGGPKFVYRADGKSFGTSPGANRANSYRPAGWVTAIACARGEAPGKTIVFVAQRGRMELGDAPRLAGGEPETAGKVTVHNGGNGTVMAELPLAGPRGLAVQGGMLHALHAQDNGFAVSASPLANGLPDGHWTRLFTVPATIQPADLEVDNHGRFYLSDTAANKVFQLDRAGKVLRTYGRLAAQKPGSYDPETFMAPAKLATWTDAQGQDRLIVVEQAGPNRASEWSAEGKLLREFLSLQTKANDGYGNDPEHPEHIYLPGHLGWLTRFRVDYATGKWTVDAVWPYEDKEPRTPDMDRAQFIRWNGRAYLACRRSLNIYRFDGDRLLLSAAVLKANKAKGWPAGLWHDANGNGHVDEAEITPAATPAGVVSYHGQNWLDDLSLLAPAQGGQDVWRLAPSGFDAHGNPIFKDWKKLLTDPVFVARSTGKADALHGGNELAESFTSDWYGADGSLADGFYVQARGGRNFSANEGAQHKITRYIPDGAGGWRLKWRTGRSALQGLAQPGEMYGAMKVRRPINGLLSIVDQSRCGVLLYTEDGLYVDTIFPDGRRFKPDQVGVYAQPGEFFAGAIFPNRENGKIYFAMGKYTPMLYEVEGWSLMENPVRPLATLPKTVSITAAQIASPPELALSLRGGAGVAKVARFAPALGEVALDGSMQGWEASEPVVFQADKVQTVEVRCLYRPEQLLLRWHVRLGTRFEPKNLPALERIFTHDQLADTLSFYLQGDVNAKPNGPNEGRPGDVRLVFGVFRDKDGQVRPVVVGFHPEWTGAGQASPQVYRTPVGQTRFAHVGPILGAQLAQVVDADGKGLVLVAAIPRAAIPRLKQSFAGGFRTLVNFEATFGGHNKFWWANRDGSASRETYDEPTEARLYPGSWAPAQFQGLEGGVPVRHWLICGPFGGSGAEKFEADPMGLLPGTQKDMKEAVREFCDAAKYPLDDGKVDLKTAFTGEMVKGYWGDPGRVSWKPASLAELDTRVRLGGGGQVWYGAAWVHAPAVTELKFQFQGHHQTFLRWILNGETVPVTPADYSKGDDHQHPVAVKTLSLRPGWNQVLVRGYCTGYPPVRVGLVLDGPAEKLWTLQLSATPPP
jgi:hypothetical protein